MGSVLDVFCFGWVLTGWFYCRDKSHQEPDAGLYSFNMAALMDHLKSQGEQNKSASYFNIDILKYQVITTVMCVK